MRALSTLAVLAAMTAPAAAAEAEQFMNICRLQKDPAACDASGRQFLALHGAALKGDYSAQRNVALTFAKGVSAAVPRNPVQACAWRMVIVAGGTAKADGTDASNLQTDCSTLSAAERATAQARASAIGRTIRAGGDPHPAAASAVRPSKSLDGNAEPL